MGTKEQLYEPFTNIRSRRGKGGTYDYISWKDVVDRMNDIFGTSWSSEVRSQETFGKDIVVKVRVTVVSDTKGHIYQEGFGGATNFEGSEPGNAYKSAYSKALKDACRKWGVGLYLEEDTDTSAAPAPQNMNTPPAGFSGFETGVPPTPTAPATPPVQNQPGPPAYEAPAPPNGPPISSGGLPTPPGVEMTPTQAIPTAPPAQAVPSTPVPPTEAPVAPAVEQPVPPTAAPPAPPAAPAVPTPPPAQELPMTSMGGSASMISDVQRAALASILQMQTISYEQLTQEAFEFNGVVKNPIPTIDELTYDEAVYVVKYGNDKFRKR